jgi:hypothetical protein
MRIARNFEGGDAIALGVIGNIGIFSGEDPSRLDEAIDGIEPPPEALSSRTVALQGPRRRGLAPRRSASKRAVNKARGGGKDEELDRTRWNAYLSRSTRAGPLGPRDV